MKKIKKNEIKRLKIDLKPVKIDLNLSKNNSEEDDTKIAKKNIQKVCTNLFNKKDFKLSLKNNKK
jgi:hypothetical protein